MNLLTDGPEGAPYTLVLAHGAGAPMDSPFMQEIATLVATEGIRVVRFEFPYMASRRTGPKRPPDREAVLRQAWLDVIEGLGGGDHVAIGGKSMGGRIASMVADEARVRGLVCLGYPFHPAGRPDRLRTAHLEALRTPALFAQGERDPFGSRAEVAGYALSWSIRMEWLADGDHSFRPRKASGHTLEAHMRSAATAVVDFMRDL